MEIFRQFYDGNLDSLLLEDSANVSVSRYTSALYWIAEAHLERTYSFTIAAKKLHRKCSTGFWICLWIT